MLSSFAEQNKQSSDPLGLDLWIKEIDSLDGQGSMGAVRLSKVCGTVPVMVESFMLGPAPSYEQTGSFVISLSLASGSMLQSVYSSDQCPLSVSKLVSNKYARMHR